MEGTMGVISLVPIILAIGLAVKTRNVLISLAVGVFAGVLIQVGGNPVTATQTMISEYLFKQLMDSYNVGIIVLLVFIGGFVTLIEKSGGAEAFAKRATAFVNTRCKAQLSAWLGGILVFFSELGTPLIVGPIFEPLFKKIKISKEKLAWIIDTTSSPVCILLPFIGWGVYSMGLIQKEFEALSITSMTDWSAFISAIPFQFYAILCLVFVPLVAFSGREFGAMAKAEADAKKGIFTSLSEDESKETKKIVTDTDVSPKVVVIPLIVLFVTLFGILMPLGFPVKQVPGGTFRIALITAYFYGAISMIGLMVYYKVDTLKGSVHTYIKGLGKMFECIMILILAWSLSSVGSSIGTANFIVELASGTIPAWSIPAIIFLIGAVISFSTGTSWGTFAIMMPIAIPMAHHLGAPMYVCIAAVLSGGLFGDHCSPISDTTILAATGSDCTLLNHVNTQLPYALLCGGVSFVGYIIAGIVDSVLVTVGCIVLLYVVYYIASRKWGIKVEDVTA